MTVDCYEKRRIVKQNAGCLATRKGSVTKISSHDTPGKGKIRKGSTTNS